MFGDFDLSFLSPIGRKILRPTAATRKPAGRNVTGPRKIVRDERLFIDAAAKAFQVLEAFDAKHPAMNTAEVAEVTGLGRSAVQRLIFTLVDLGYLQRDEATKRMSLSAKVLSLGSHYLRSATLIQQAHPHLVAGNESCGETLALAKFDRTEIVIVDQVPCKHTIGVTIPVGARYPAYCSASGLTFLAHLEEREATTILKSVNRVALTMHTIVELNELLTALRAVRARGFGLTLQAAVIGDVSVAAPIFDQSDRVVATASISAPAFRWPGKSAIEKLGAVAVAAALGVSSQLGWTPRA